MFVRKVRLTNRIRPKPGKDPVKRPRCCGFTHVPGPGSRSRAHSEPPRGRTGTPGPPPGQHAGPELARAPEPDSVHDGGRRAVPVAEDPGVRMVIRKFRVERLHGPRQRAEQPDVRKQRPGRR